MTMTMMRTMTKIMTTTTTTTTTIPKFNHGGDDTETS